MNHTPSDPSSARERGTAAARILVVEDEEDLAGLLLYKLRAAGHIAEHASTGAGALARAKEFRPDLILLDLMLPDISGTDVLQAIQGDSDLAHTSVIIVTARGEEADRIAGRDAGAVDYVAKPFGVQALMLRVAAVLNALARNEWIDSGLSTLAGELNTPNSTSNRLGLPAKGVSGTSCNHGQRGSHSSTCSRG
jgi:two-component system, OmpR family, phosphate regulon response regulator PhoB